MRAKKATHATTTTSVQNENVNYDCAHLSDVGDAQLLKIFGFLPEPSNDNDKPDSFDCSQ